jgi:beta-phosphoglucomutase-like phosphatase (HAD superfamily)
LTDLSGYAAVLSDLDGTLVDSEAPVRRAWTAFARRQGLDAGEVVRFAQGRTNSAIARELVVTLGAIEKHISSVFGKLGLTTSDDGHRRVLAVLAHLRAESG